MPCLGCKIWQCVSAQNGVHYGSFRRPYNIGDSTRSAEAVRQLFAVKGLTILQLTANLPGPLTQVCQMSPLPSFAANALSIPNACAACCLLNQIQTILFEAVGNSLKRLHQHLLSWISWTTCT